jgi:hypothetical protein
MTRLLAIVATTLKRRERWQTNEHSPVIVGCLAAFRRMRVAGMPVSLFIGEKGIEISRSAMGSETQDSSGDLWKLQGVKAMFRKRAIGSGTQDV